MARTLTTAVTNELATNDIRPVHLVSIGFSTPVNLTDASFDITSSISGSSKTYSASAFLITVPTFTEETDVTKTTVNVALSGANTTFISTVLNENIVIEETETTSTVNLSVVSHWADFEKKSGRQTNNNSQQRFFSTDVGMDFASQTVLDIKWGRK